MNRWYAVQAKPREDARAEAHLRRQGFDIFRPMLRARKRRAGCMRSVLESLFPRYLFIHLDDHDNWMPIRSTRGVVGLVRFGHRPAPVPDEVIDEIRCRMGPDNHCLDFSETIDYRPNEPVTITEGPFEGFEALFQARKGKDRVTVLLSLMRQVQRATLPDYAITR
jgi:transcriptional antiterminator RfaH